MRALNQSRDLMSGLFNKLGMRRKTHWEKAWDGTSEEPEQPLPECQTPSGLCSHHSSPLERRMKVTGDPRSSALPRNLNPFKPRFRLLLSHGDSGTAPWPARSLRPLCPWTERDVGGLTWICLELLQGTGGWLLRPSGWRSSGGFGLYTCCTHPHHQRALLFLKETLR